MIILCNKLENLICGEIMYEINFIGIEITQK